MGFSRDGTETEKKEKKANNDNQQEEQIARLAAQLEELTANLNKLRAQLKEVRLSSRSAFREPLPSPTESAPHNHAPTRQPRSMSMCARRAPDRTERTEVPGSKPKKAEKRAKKNT